eukprot:GFYU01001320.1.p1 GENE.GFYU01001320.1~~GFYU01001320.1.p1  ORF type:complete len:1032 (+),score=360.14 GFYU01001320.1:92-3187(+)
MGVTPLELSNIQTNPEKIRNICVLAHVDHGKTTLSDGLIASNGIISNRSAGKIRYMDSRDDEQQRCITMKSSSIALKYQHIEGGKLEDYLINLVDSPGHVDFSSEVSTALRCTDGGVVVVDAVEGVCIQTHAVLKQAWSESVRPVVVINKVDRLITELQFEPLEAFDHLRKIMEQLNMIVTTFHHEQLFESMGQSTNLVAEDGSDVADTIKIDWSLLDEEDTDMFSPAIGNVVFASAFDGWAFNLNQFANLYAKKMGVRKEVLQKTLWGDFYLNAKTKTIVKKNVSGKMRPMFVQFVLENIYQLYDACIMNRDDAKVEKIVKSLGLQVPPRELNHKDDRLLLRAVASRWLPLSPAILNMVVRFLPSPKEAQRHRFPKLWPELFDAETDNAEILKMREDVMTCNPSQDAACVVFVAKMYAVPASALPELKHRSVLSKEDMERRRQMRLERIQQQRKEKEEAEAAAAAAGDDAENDATGGAAEVKAPQVIDLAQQEVQAPDQHFIGFARVLSGRLDKGKKMYILNPKHKADLKTEELNVAKFKHATEAEIDDIFLMMGRDLERCEFVSAGNVFGIGGVGECISRFGIVSSSLRTPSMTIGSGIGAPIVRVAIETENPMEMPQLLTGLKLLSQADPAVEVLVQETGEHVIVCAGEVHLERCVKDLADDFAKVKLDVSKPIVPFKETVSAPSPVVTTRTPNGRYVISIQAKPLPNDVTQFLDKNTAALRSIFVDRSAKPHDVEKFREELGAVLKEAGGAWPSIVDSIWAMGPRRYGPNILLNKIPAYVDSGLWKSKLNTNKVDKTAEPGSPDPLVKFYQSIDNSIATGFQLATLQSPLCEEPMSGVCFEVVNIEEETDEELWKDSQHMGPVTGQVISSVKEACRQAFVKASPRLVEAMYLVDIQAHGDALGKVLGVLSKRRVRVTSEDMKEGTQIFVIQGYLPVVESFGFAAELRTKTSGAAQSQLLFDHWDTMEEDPFFVPTTEDELEEFGHDNIGNEPNIVIGYINAVRRRKGLQVEHKIVESAEKQRTLKRK